MGDESCGCARRRRQLSSALGSRDGGGWGTRYRITHELGLHRPFYELRDRGRESDAVSTPGSNPDGAACSCRAPRDDRKSPFRFRGNPNDRRQGGPGGRRGHARKSPIERHVKSYTGPSVAHCGQPDSGAVGYQTRRWARRRWATSRFPRRQLTQAGANTALSTAREVTYGRRRSCRSRRPCWRHPAALEIELVDVHGLPSSRVFASAFAPTSSCCGHESTA